MNDDQNETEHTNVEPLCSNCVHFERGLCNAFFEERDPDEKPLKKNCFEMD